MPLPTGSSRIIEEWFKKNNLELPSRFIDMAELYHDLILAWSVRMNIVSKRDLDKLVERHILDSIVPAPLIPMHGNLLDVGSGGGFPAVPIALIRPHLKITMLESQRKKTLFLREVKRRLGLVNVQILNIRLEDFRPTGTFDIVTMRAISRWESFIERLKEMLSPGGKIIYYEKRGRYRLIE